MHSYYKYISFQGAFLQVTILMSTAMAKFHFKEQKDLLNPFRDVQQLKYAITQGGSYTKVIKPPQPTL